MTKWMRCFGLLLLLTLPLMTLAEDNIVWSLDFGFKRELSYLLSIFIACVLGCIIGVSLSFRRDAAITVTSRTYGAVSIGAALFSCICLHQYAVLNTAQAISGMSAIITGIGFLCAAVIIRQGPYLTGLSTSSSLWTTSIIGVACGMELYTLSIFTTLILCVFQLFPAHSRSTAMDAVPFNNKVDQSKPDAQKEP